MRRKIYIFLTFTYAFLILVFSSLPKLSSIEKPGIDKVEHAIEYSILGFLLLSCFKRRNGLTVIVVFIFASIYGVFDEFHQYFIPGRDCSGLDMIADSFGSLFGILLKIRADRKTKKYSFNTESLSSA